MKTIFSGIKPSGELTIGHIIGAVSQWLDTQKEDGTKYFCVADLHAITVYQEPSDLLRRSYLTAAVYLASGIDPKKSTLFIQSHVKEHSELAWLLNCVARVGWMDRMTQFKEKSGTNKEKASLGLYAYPSLMAADILLYDSTHVPVGDDQKQHVELCRDIAQKFNHDYKKNLFVIPQPVIKKEGARIMSLKDASKKMSKSDDEGNGIIYLLDSNDAIASKIKRAKTDTEPIPDNIKALDSRPEVKNLLTIYSSLSGLSLSDTVKEFAGNNFGTFKPILTEKVIECVAPIRDKTNELMNNKDYLESILKKGADTARQTASKKVDAVKKTMGFAIF